MLRTSARSFSNSASLLPAAVLPSLSLSFCLPSTPLCPSWLLSWLSVPSVFFAVRLPSFAYSTDRASSRTSGAHVSSDIMAE